MDTIDYSFRQIDTSDEELLKTVSLLQETFPKNKKFSFEYLRWQYTQNPLGNVIGYNAWIGNEIAAHLAGLPIEMNIYGRKYKGLLWLNVATGIKHRGKKLYATLCQKTIDYAKANNIDFILGVANQNTTRNYLTYFDFYLISGLPVKVGLSRKIYSDKQFDCYVSWSKEQWEWRLKNPSNKYSCKNINIVYSPISFFAKTLSKSIYKGTKEFNSQHIGYRPINLYIGLGANTSKCGYVQVPSFIKHSPFNVVFKDLTGNIPEIKKEDLFFQLLDFDVI